MGAPAAPLRRQPGRKFTTYMHALPLGEHPQVALIAIALQLCQGTLALQGFHRLPPNRCSAVAPEVGLIAFCAPFDQAGLASGGPAPSPVLPAPGAFASFLLDLFVAAARNATGTLKAP